MSEVVTMFPGYLMVLFRVGGLMFTAPLVGSNHIPRQLKIAMAAVIALGMVRLSDHVEAPRSLSGLALGLGGEILFGVAMGMIVALIFAGAQWAGELIGQQMGLNLDGVFDPRSEGSGSVMGQAYFLLTAVIFLAINGHHSMLLGLKESFTALPVMSVGVTKGAVDTMVGFLDGSTVLAIRLAAPMLVSILVVDLVLGFLGKTVPGLNGMGAGMPLRAMVGMVVLIVMISSSSDVIRNSILSSLREVVR